MPLHRHALPILLLASGCADSGSSDPAGGTGSTGEADTGSDTHGETTGGELPDMVHVPAGPFFMGCVHEISDGCRADALPLREVTLHGFSIDRTEVTQAEYQACVDAGACAPVNLAECQCETPGPFPTPGIDCDGVWDPVAKANHPVSCIRWRHARDFCAWEGKRLPTEAEWEKAARGQGGHEYPWGNDPITCGHSQFATCGDDTEPVGGLEPGKSPYGAMDMSGNVAEFVLDRYGQNYYRDDPPDEDPPGHAYNSRRVARGGSFDTLPFEDEFSSWQRRNTHEDFLPEDGIGFRCLLPDAGLPECGNGVVEPSEVCDDRNDISGDGCEADCSASGAGTSWLSSGFPGMSSSLRGTVGFADDLSAIAGAVRVTGSDLDTLFVPPVPFDFANPFSSVSVNGFNDSDDAPNATALFPGGFVTAGYCNQDATLTDVLLRIYSGQLEDYAPQDGREVEWEWAYDAGTGGIDEALDVAVTSLGRILVVGNVQATEGNTDGWLAAVDPYAAAGSEIIWQQLHDAGGRDTADSVAIARDGTILVSGTTAVDVSRRIRIAAYAADGSGELWSDITDNVEEEADASSNTAVAVDPDGMVYVAGGLPIDEDTNALYVAKYDPDGTQLWSVETEGDGAQDLEIAPDGNLLVAAGDRVIKWRADGSEVMWSSEPGFGETFHSISRSPGDQLFIVGSNNLEGTIVVIEGV